MLDYYASICVLCDLHTLQVLRITSQAAFSSLESHDRSAIYKPQIAEVSAIGLYLILYYGITLHRARLTQ
jgi:hypothetical protein